MDKQLLEQEAKEKYPFSRFKQYEGERQAYIAGATSSSTVKRMQDELRTVITEYEYAMKLLCEATGQVYSENNVTISAKKLLNL